MAAAATVAPPEREDDGAIEDAVELLVVAQQEWAGNLCGTFGCKLPDKHSGLHNVEHVGTRVRRSKLRFGDDDSAPCARPCHQPRPKATSKGSQPKALPCEHGRQRSQCKECGGSRICEHGNHRSKCKDCGGSQICEHGRQRYTCKDCGGSGICEHGRARSLCTDCSPCPGGHGNSRTSCTLCNACEHERHKHRCKECKAERLRNKRRREDDG